MKKKLLIILLLLAFAITSFEQTSTDSSAFNHTNYLNKSKKQRTAAWIMLGGGFVFTATGFIIGLYSTGEELIDVFGGEQSNKFEVGAVIFLTGTAAMLGSIPLFIASSKNKKRGMALSASLKMEKATAIRNYSVAKTNYPAFSIKINF